MEHTPIELLQSYIDHFDNPNWSNKAMKEWLDSDWIPEVRELLAKLEVK